MVDTDLVHPFDTLETVIESTPDHFITSTAIGCTDQDYQTKILVKYSVGQTLEAERLALAGIMSGSCIIFEAGEILLLIESHLILDKVRRSDSQTEYWIARGLMKQNR